MLFLLLLWTPCFVEKEIHSSLKLIYLKFIHKLVGGNNKTSFQEQFQKDYLPNRESKSEKVV